MLRASSRAALGEIARGNPDGYKSLYSRRPDITLGNPFGGFGRGEAEVFEQLERAASHYRDGETIEFETVSQLVDRDLAYTVEIERFCAKVGGRSDASDGRVFRDAHSEGKNGEGCPSGDLGQVRETVDPLSQMSPDGVQFDRPVQCRRHGPPNPVNAGFATQHQEEHLQ